MLARLPHFSLATLSVAALTLGGSLAFAQPPAAPPAAATQAQPAPIERQPPSDSPNAPNWRRSNARGPIRPGTQSGVRPGGMRGQTTGRPSFRGSAMMHHEGGNFHGGPGGGFHGSERGGPHGEMDGGFHIGPGGMWWKNPMVVQRLTLTPDQVKRMDGIFQQSRIQLIDLKANVEKQEVMLEPLLGANPPDTAKASLQIDKVADARADLEKANAKMLLGIRAVLTPDQWTKLSTHGAPGPQSQSGGPGTDGGGPGRGRGPGGPAGMSMDDTRP